MASSSEAEQGLYTAQVGISKFPSPTNNQNPKDSDA